MAISLTNHGGRCCGRRHFVGFYAKSKSTAFKEVAAAMTQIPNNRATEAVLLDRQGLYYGDALATFGFVPVYRFVNGNTANPLTVFMFCHSNGNIMVKGGEPIKLPYSFKVLSKEEQEKLQKTPSVVGKSLYDAYAILGIRYQIARPFKVQVNLPNHSRNGRTGTIIGGRYNSYGTYVYTVQFDSSPFDERKLPNCSFNARELTVLENPKADDVTRWKAGRP